MHIVISNISDLPIYVQIKEQVKEQILSGELEEDEMLPSLRQLAKDLKISVLTSAILAAERASMTDEELIKLLRLLLEVNHE